LHAGQFTRKDHPGAAEPVALDGFCDVPQIFLGHRIVRARIVEILQES
jgi:hypothetical protein